MSSDKITMDDGNALKEKTGSVELGDNNFQGDPSVLKEQYGIEAEVNDPAVLRQMLREQNARLEDYHNRLARLQADFENYRRRTRQEMDNFYKYASEQLITSLLPVLDNFSRAVLAEGDSLESFKAGVDLIHRQLKEVLAAEGLASIQAVGEQFDPEKHEAVMQAEATGYPDNTVVEELRCGYCLKDKVIRPSMVKVAKS